MEDSKRKKELYERFFSLADDEIKNYFDSVNYPNYELLIENTSYTKLEDVNAIIDNLIERYNVSFNDDDFIKFCYEEGESYIFHKAVETAVKYHSGYSALTKWQKQHNVYAICHAEDVFYRFR